MKKILAYVALIFSTQVVAWPQSLPPGIPTVSGANADVIVTFDAHTGIFSYSYLVANSTASIGALDHFFVDITTTSSNVILTPSALVNSATGYASAQQISDLNRQALGNSVIPVGFTSQPPGWIVGLDANGAASWTSGFKAPEIAPGHSMSSFSMQSPGLPGIRRFDVGAYFEPGLFFPGIDEVDSDTAALKITNEVNAAALACLFKGMTVGPVSPPSLTDVGQLLGFLISQKEQAASQGWIGNQEFIKDLDEKLDQAKKAFAKDKPFEARHKLREFIHKLEEQRKEQFKRQHEASEEGHEEREEHSEGDKKFINDNAFYLLKPNAEFIIFKLPAKPEDDDTDSKDRDH